MSSVPTMDQISQGYEPPRNVQFSVFLDNRVGKLLDLTEVFDNQPLTLAGLSVLDSANHAVVRILTSNSELARRLLARHDLPFSEAEVLAVELDNTRTMSRMCQSLLACELNVYYIYPLLIRPRGRAVVAMQTDDVQLSAQVLRKKNFTLLAENDMGDNAPGTAPTSPTDPSDN